MSGSTTVSNHPSSAVLLDYVTGTLGFAHRCVLATHLRTCSTCQGTVRFLERVGDRVLSAMVPVEPPPDLLDRCILSISQEESVQSRRKKAKNQLQAAHEASGIVPPPSLDDIRPGRLRWLAPGLWHRTLWHDEHSTLHYIRVKPGVTLPGHRHRGLELTCVLSGAYHDGNGRLYAAGDLSEEDDEEDNLRGDDDHLVVAELSQDCVCVMATTGRLLFSGWIARLLQPVMPF